MPRPSENLIKVTIRLHAGDKERLDEFYPNLGHNKAIRTLIRKHIRKLDESFSTQLADVQDIEVEI